MIWRRLITPNQSLSIIRFLSDQTMSRIKVLNVAEKNDAAKNIAELLSRGRMQRASFFFFTSVFADLLSIFQKEGLSKYNKIYEFQYEIDGQMCDMRMTSVSGHLLGHDFEDKYRKWYSCPPAQLFDLPVVKACREENSLKIKVLISI